MTTYKENGFTTNTPTQAGSQAYFLTPLALSRVKLCAKIAGLAWQTIAARPASAEDFCLHVENRPQDKPKGGEVYRLTSADAPSIGGGNSWSESVVDKDERRDSCTCCHASPIMGFDTPSGVLCCDCANDLHDEGDCKPRERKTLAHVRSTIRELNGKPFTLYGLDDAERLAKQLRDGDPEWSYAVVPVDGGRWAKIEARDEDGLFLGNI